MQKSLQYFFVLILLAPFGRVLAQAPVTVDNSPSPPADEATPARSRDDRSRLGVNNQADVPAPQANPLFMAAHKALLEKTKQGVIDVYFLGDSITRRWQGTDYPEHKKNWDHNFVGWNAANFGWGGDSTQNVLWRLQNGELDGVNPKVVVLMIGTNNLGNTTSSDEIDARVEQVTCGIRAILDVIQEKAPTAKIVLTGITPRNDVSGNALLPAIEKINSQIATFANGDSIIFLNINDKLADRNGKLFAGVTEDGLHLSIKGYQIWADALKPLFTRWLGPPGKTDRAPPASGIPTISGVP